MAGPKKDYLFTDVDKEKGMRIVKDLCRLYLVEPISMAWMGNHWHIVLFVPGVPPSVAETATRYNQYYGSKHKQLDPVDQDECERVAAQLVDISFFMRQVHQKFTYHINKAHDRRGTLWADRFKSVILQDRGALWECVKYVELNAVRAGLVADPGDYRFCTWGYFRGTGKHFFGDNFTRHLKRSLGEVAAKWSDEQLCAEFSARLARTIARERGASDENMQKATEDARRGDSIPVHCLRRTRHWTDGAIIGSKSFVRDVACMFEARERVMRRRLSIGRTTEGDSMCCLKRLRVSTDELKFFVLFSRSLTAIS